MYNVDLDDLRIELEVLKQEREDICFEMIEAFGTEYDDLESKLNQLNYEIERVQEGIKEYERAQG